MTYAVVVLEVGGNPGNQMSIDVRSGANPSKVVPAYATLANH